MNVKKTSLEGLLLVELDQHADERGFFMETYQRARYEEAGIEVDFVQDNHSHVHGGIMKGMHFTVKTPQSMLVSVSSGSMYDVVVDLRAGSPSYAEWYGMHLSASPACQLFIPAGFAHGFYVTGDHADVHYKVSHYYDPEDEGGVSCHDPQLGIRWPSDEATLNRRDKDYPNLSDLSDEDLPAVRFNGADH